MILMYIHDLVFLCIWLTSSSNLCSTYFNCLLGTTTDMFFCPLQLYILKIIWKTKHVFFSFNKCETALTLFMALRFSWFARQKLSESSLTLIFPLALTSMKLWGPIDFLCEVYSPFIAFFLFLLLPPFFLVFSS